MTSKKTGFTLIEMMVVIVVVAMLSALVFKIARTSDRSSEKAKMQVKLQRLAMAIEEFKSEYGIYPPTDKVDYVYENTNFQTDFLINNYFGDYPAEIGYQYGLLSYLLPRERDHIYHTSNPTRSKKAWIADTPRDEAAKERWLPFIEDIVDYGNRVPSSPTNWLETSEGHEYANSRDTVPNVSYRSDPPYLDYELKGKLPDGTVIDKESM
jgi:prepilin-type N-terminal cleavage/methylation domain-containing protein